MRAKSINDEDTGFIDIEENVDGSIMIKYKRQTSEDDYDVEENRYIDPYHMDTYLGLKLGLSLQHIHDDELTIHVKNIKKLNDDEWEFQTNYGDVKITLGILEKLADKR